MFKHMKIGKKLIVAFVVITILASISGGVGLAMMNTLNAQYSTALVVNGFAQGDLGRFNTALNRGAALVRDMIFLNDKAELEQTKKELDVLLEDANSALEDLREKCQTPDELKQIAIIDKNLPLYQDKRAQVIDLGLAMKNDEALNLFREEAQPYLNQCVNAVEALIALNIDMGNSTADSLQSRANFSTGVIVAVTLGAMVISILLGLYIAHSISRPIQACSDRLALLADGDLHSPVPESDSQDEAGVMLAAVKKTTESMQLIIHDIDMGLNELSNGNLNVTSNIEYHGDFIAIKNSIQRIIHSLNNTLGSISQSSEQVASGSDQVSSGAQALSQGATEQASSIQELAATINEISEQVKKNAANAEQANRMADGVGKEMASSNRQMQNMIQAMQEISSSSSEISKIIKTIEDIAFQTNILALNAAVEAARAGAAGKGFAVVADEVRNLASKSSEASKNTSALIGKSISAVENGTRIADETAKSLLSAVDDAKEMAKTIGQISEASNEQAVSILQVTQGIDQISSVVQTNSATAEESAAASEELSGQAQILKDLVSRFQLKGQTDGMEQQSHISFDSSLSDPVFEPDSSKY